MKQELYPEYFCGEISRGNALRKEIALTFDGGGGKSYTREILDVLASVDVLTTTFLTGGFIRRNPDDTKRLLESGQEVANHTMSHPWLSPEGTWKTHGNATKEVFRRELETADDLFFELTHSRLTNLWRAPYGARSREILEWGGELGLTHVHWTHDTADWRTDMSDSLSKSGSEIIGTLLQHQTEVPHGLNGSIILLHLGAQREVDPLYPRLADFCRTLKEQGFTFVKVSQMLQHRGGHALSGDLPLPSSAALPLVSGFEQVGGVEGYFEDSWIWPRFSARLRPEPGVDTARLSFYLPELLNEQELTFFVDGIQQHVLKLTGGQTKDVTCVVPSSSFTLDVHSKFFISPHLSDAGLDSRYLSALLTRISS